MMTCIRTGLDCVHCFLNQAQTLAEKLEMSREDTEDLVHRALASLSASDFMQSPPEIAETFYDVICQCSGVADPYAKEKDSCNRRLLAMIDPLRTLIVESVDPFAAAMKLCIAANAIDFGVVEHDGVTTVIDTIQTMVKPPLEPHQVECLRTAVNSATSILYLADNAGEIVLDKLFIEQLPMEKVTVAVRGRAVINDCTMADAEQVGLTELVRVIDNGTGIPGTVVERCSQDFKDAWDAADVVIAKGQGNFETLVGHTSKTCFMLKVKCHVVAEELDLAIGDIYVGFATDAHFEA